LGPAGKLGLASQPDPIALGLVAQLDPRLVGLTASQTQ